MAATHSWPVSRHQNRQPVRTTVYGGTTTTEPCSVEPDTGVETVIYSFKGGTDGTNPYSSVVARVHDFR